MTVPHLACPFCGELIQPTNLVPGGEVVCPSCSKVSLLEEEPLDQNADALLDEPSASDAPETRAVRLEDSSDNLLVGLQGSGEGKDQPSLKEAQARKGVNLTWGDFQLRRKLGAGNMGAVYLAFQNSLSREVAIKVLYRHLAQEASLVERFYREAEAMSRLDHPGIVKCFGAGEVDRRPYFAMEYIHGFSVDALRQELGGTFRPGDALYVARCCAEALGHAHERGVVHRDVKPENILITQLGYVKLTDLGLAKADVDLSLTDSGVSLGTPYYMAPEQARDAKHADRRSDIYALGCVLYQLLTGRLPFQEDGLVKLIKAKELGVFPAVHRINADLPEYLSLILDRMLAKDPARRYQGCGEVIRALDGTGLVNDHLSFNVLRVGKVLGASTVSEPEHERKRVEVLLLGDRADDVALVQETLDRVGVANNLTVLRGPQEALALLRREDPHADATRPDLVIVGLDLGRKDVARFLQKFTRDEYLQGMPLVILSWSAPSSACLLRAQGLPATLNILQRDELRPFEDLIRSVHEMCLTAIEGGWSD